MNDTCHEHQSPLEYCCLDCKKILCARCVVRDHRPHEIQSLEETLADITKEINICLQHLNQKSLRVRENQTVTVSKIDQVKEAKASLIICIKQHADHLRKQIDEDEQVLITKVEQQTGKILDSLNDEKCLHDRELTSLETLEAWATTITQNVNGSKAVEEFHGGLLERLKASRLSPIPDKSTASQYKSKFTPSVLIQPENIIGDATLENTGASHAGMKNYVLF
jgi:hypothetical protein